jgi:Tannase-like family of unknown function (DUF6351)
MKSAIASLLALGTISLAAVQTNAPAGRIELKTLSTDPALVTGGDVLLQVSLPPGTAAETLRVAVAGRDVTRALRAGSSPNTFMGLVSGLANGKNVIEASAGGRAHASLEVTNYPTTGPVISGPWQQPFICQTDMFALPDGTKLGPPLDANCSARTVVQYVYVPTGTAADARAPFKPLPSTTVLPSDVAKTTTTAGATVNFIVRVETGTMNRGIYQNAVLFDPTIDRPPTPFSPPKGWNRRLLAVHGSGCPSGWFIQGAALGVSVLDRVHLAEGYAVFNNTLNHPTNSCNAFLAGETTMMGKEHFIETFGVPFYTVSTGGSGGAYTSLQIADAFPGLFDAVDIRATFPDAFAIANSGLDAHLLTNYLQGIPATAMSEKQVLAIGGYQGMKAMIDAANQAQRTDPVPNREDIEGYQSARWNAVVPESLRYDPMKNPKGARPTVFDAARNIYGVNPATGAALRPWDNTGVQYGLNALNAGVITPAQFLDLNETIGGIDQDSGYVPTRTVGDLDAIKRAYQAGLTLGANGGLMSIPVLDNATSNETGGYHYGWFHFALRERVRQANGGSSENMVMWRSVSGSAGQELLEKWIVAYKADASADPQRTKMLRARPKEAVDGCYDKSTPPRFIADALPFSSQPVSKCTELYPVYSNPRREAGGPLAANILKCQLKPVVASDYHVALTPAELARIKAIFPEGVCDWSKPGVNQVPVVTWASFGPSPKNLVFEIGRPVGSSR